MTERQFSQMIRMLAAQSRLQAEIAAMHTANAQANSNRADPEEWPNQPDDFRNLTTNFGFDVDLVEKTFLG